MTAILAVVSLGLAAMVVGVQRVRQGLVDGAQHFRLHFGSPVEAKAVEHFLAGSAGWRAPWWRPWASPVVMAEVMATKDGVSFTFVVPQVWVISFERLLDAHLPGIHAQRVTAESLVVTAAATYRLTASDRPLRVEPAAQVRTLLSALQPLGDDDRIVVQWAFLPQSPVAPSPDASSGWRAKQSAPVLGAVLRIGAAAASVRSAQALVRRAEVALHLSNSIGVHFTRVRVPEHSVIRRLEGRRVPIGAPPIVINVQELVGPLGFPVGATLPSGIAPSGCRPLRASEALPSEGSVVGDSDMPGDARPVALSLEARFRHVMLSGPTGVGKSTLLLNLICDDLERGRGLLVVDPKRDLIEDVLARVPEHRREDVVVLDPADAANPVGFNPLSGGGDAELNVEQVVSVMHRLWASSWGVRTEDLLRASLRTLTEDDLAVLSTLDRLRLVAGPQLQRLHQGDGEAAKQRRIRQLSRLSRLGLVVRLPRRVGGPQAGSFPSIYTLDAAAQRLLHPDSRARRPWTPSHPFLAHAIAVSEVYVAVVEATKAIGAAVVAFAVEPECWRSHQAGLGQQTVLKPDAHAVIVTDEEEYHWFIEVDRSTENITRLAAKCRAHVGYWHTGDEDRRHGVSPQVLWVVPDERRQAQVLKVIRGLDPSDWPLFAVTTAEHAAAVLCGLMPTGGAS